MSGLRALLEDGRVHVFDGAMGTVIYDRGVFVNVCYDELNLSQPELVESIHREYVLAGAEILETNTFGANPVKLSGFGLEEKTEEINRAAAVVARRAAGDEARVVGAIGPLGVRIEPWGPTGEEEAEAFFRRQVEGLLEGGVDGFLLETFSDVNELHQALKAVRALSDLPVIAQVTVEEGGVTSYGTEVEQAARQLEEWGADAVGLNCSVGPAEILDAVERMASVTDLPLVAQPNAGLPRSVGDRKIYLASPEYMARYARRMVEAGVRFVGGCCGTRPEHIRQIRTSVLGEELEKGSPVVVGLPERGAASPGSPETERGEPDRPGRGTDPSSMEERSALGRKLAQGSFVTALEVMPPEGWDPHPLLEYGRKAREAGADVVSVVEATRGRRRMSSIPAGMLLAREKDVEVVVHYTCRDRNMLRMISDLLGAAAGGIRNLLVVSGDLVPVGSYPDHTAVFDIDSIGLTNVLDHLNRGVDPGGHPVDPPTRFVVGVALNQGAADLERERSRFGWKVEAGADFAVSQPVFDVDGFLSFLDRLDGVTVPILAGLWPLSSLRDAEYLANEVPGVRVPERVLRRMEEAEGRGEKGARDEGRRIALEVLEAVLPRVQGIHVTSPRRDPELALAVVREVRSSTETSQERDVAAVAGTSAPDSAGQGDDRGD